MNYSIIWARAYRWTVKQIGTVDHAAQSPGPTLMRVSKIYFDGAFRFFMPPACMYLVYARCGRFRLTFFVLHFESFPWKWCRLLFRDPPASILITISTDVLMEAPNTTITLFNITFTHSLAAAYCHLTPPFFPAVVSNFIIHRFFIALSFGSVCFYSFYISSTHFSALSFASPDALVVWRECVSVLSDRKYGVEHSQNWHFNVLILAISYDKF